MINKVLTGVKQALNVEFGADFHVYIPYVAQNLVTPAFLPRMASVSRIPSPNKSFLYVVNIVIPFVPKESKMNDLARLYEIGDLMFSALEVICLGNETYVRCDSSNPPRWEFLDEGLVFYVTYSFTCYDSAEKDTMETLEIINSM